MRLPVAFNAFNLFLIFLLILAPWLGKNLKEWQRLEEQDNQVKNLVALSIKGSQNQSASQIRLEETTKPLTLSRKENRKPRSWDEIKDEDDLKADKIAQEAKDKAAFFERIKEYARQDNYPDAESEFLKRLDSTGLSPLESLDKLAQFKSHFEKMKAHFASRETPLN